MANELATVSNNTTSLADMSIGTVLINTINGDDLEARIAASNAKSDAESLKNIGLDVKIAVRNFILTAGVRSRTGETCVDVFLICDDGKVYFSQSGGIARSAQDFIDAFTDAHGRYTAPCDKGYSFVVRERLTDSGNTVKSLFCVKS